MEGNWRILELSSIFDRRDFICIIHASECSENGAHLPNFRLELVIAAFSG